MSEQSEPETISSLSAALTQFIDYTGQTLRAHQVQLQSQQEQINSLTLLTRQVAEAQIAQNDRFNEVLARIDEMQSEVRGLQTENRRILDRMERQLPPEEPPNLT